MGRLANVPAMAIGVGDIDQYYTFIVFFSRRVLLLDGRRGRLARRERARLRYFIGIRAWRYLIPA